MLPEHEDRDDRQAKGAGSTGSNPRRRATACCRDRLRRVTAGGVRVFGPRVSG